MLHTDKKFLTKLYMHAVVPNMIAILGGTINVFFDGILVGQKLGDIGIAAINQSLAVYLVLCTVGSLIAAGASAQSAAAIGANCTQESHQYFSLAIESALLIGMTICCLGALGSGFLAEFLGSCDSQNLVEVYIRITFMGGIFKILLYIPFFYLRLIGKTSQSAIAMTVMTVLNILLDYVFLFILDWGIAGAAWASVLATMVACVLSFFFLFTAKDSFQFLPVGFRKEMFIAMIKSGSPMAANNLFSALRIVCLNSIMNVTGGSGLVAIFAITNSVNEFSICIQNGIPQAASAMLGICHGEKDPVSIKKLLKIQLKVGTSFSAVFAFFIILFSKQIGVWFGSNQNVSLALILFAISLIPAVYNSIMTYYYYATIHSVMANLITILRVFGATVLMAFLLSPYGEIIWLFYLSGELLTGMIWMSVVLMYSKITKGKADFYLLDETAFQEGKCINFTVKCDAEEICTASEKITEFCEQNDFSEEQIMTISLALEELMIIVAEKSMNNQGTLDVRILRTDEGGIIRIRSGGRRYNPLEFEGEDLEYLGVGLIKQMAKHTEYQTTLGLNTLIVII